MGGGIQSREPVGHSIVAHGLGASKPNGRVTRLERKEGKEGKGRDLDTTKPDRRVARFNGRENAFLKRNADDGAEAEAERIPREVLPWARGKHIRRPMPNRVRTYIRGARQAPRGWRREEAQSTLRITTARDDGRPRGALVVTDAVFGVPIAGGSQRVGSALRAPEVWESVSLECWEWVSSFPCECTVLPPPRELVPGAKGRRSVTRLGPVIRLSK
jgi:hypothetical protein